MVCVLSERPFDQMGLADRVVAAFETVHQYGFSTEGGETSKSAKFDKDTNPATAPKVLGLRNLRREIGPDPRLSYHGISAHASRDCRLRVEGPIGLHFERSTTAAPTFANTQFLLHYNLPENRPDLEESFAGVVLQRYVDPAWSWWPENPELASRALPATWWLDTNDLPDGLTTLSPDDTTAVVELERSGGSLDIWIEGGAAYNDNGAKKVALATFDLKSEHIAILHQFLGEGRHAISVMARPVKPDLFVCGELDSAQLVARTVYNAGRHLVLNDPDGKPVAVVPARASQSTFVEWVRSNRNLSEFVSVRPGLEKNSRVTVSELTAEVEGNVMRLVSQGKYHQIHSPVSERPYPLNVRRLQTAILRQPSKAIGRPFDLFQSAHLLDPDGSLRLPDAFDPVGATMSLAEIETHAETLVAGDEQLNANFVQFTKAHFDLFNSTSQTEDIKKVFRFDLRATNRTLEKTRS